MRVLVLGASGFLGQKVYSKLISDPKFVVEGTCCTNRRNNNLYTLDVTKEEEVKRFMLNKNPEVIAWCLTSKDERKLTNHGIPNVIKYIDEKTKFIYVTTDGFLEGKGNYTEEDLPSYLDSINPLAEYVNAKIDAENIVKQRSNNYIIARTGPLYGQDNAENWDYRTSHMAEKLSKNERIIRTENLYKTFVHVDDFAKALIEMIKINFEGTINVGPKQKESYYSFNKKMAKNIGLNSSLILNDYLDIDEARKRCIPLDTSLDTSKCRRILKTVFREV